MTPKEYRDKHPSCKYCKYICSVGTDWCGYVKHCKVREKLISSFPPIRGRFCKCYESQEIE